MVSNLLRHNGPGAGPVLFLCCAESLLDAAKQVLAVGEADAVAFGVPFLANPDLPERFRRNVPLNPPDQATFYAPGSRGYTDYPFMQEPSVSES